MGSNPNVQIFIYILKSIFLCLHTEERKILKTNLKKIKMLKTNFIYKKLLKYLYLCKTITILKINLFNIIEFKNTFINSVDVLLYSLKVVYLYKCLIVHLYLM